MRTNSPLSGVAPAGQSARRRIEENARREAACHGAGRAEQTKARSLRRVLKVVAPRDVILVEQVKNRSGDWFVASRRRKNLVRRQMPK